MFMIGRPILRRSPCALDRSENMIPEASVTEKPKSRGCGCFATTFTKICEKL